MHRLNPIDLLIFKLNKKEEKKKNFLLLNRENIIVEE